MAWQILFFQQREGRWQIPISLTVITIPGRMEMQMKKNGLKVNFSQSIPWGEYILGNMLNDYEV